MNEIAIITNDPLVTRGTTGDSVGIELLDGV